jgi:chemotaxis protein MotB
LIAGHTDNQRVSNPATVRAGHLDNWYLSAHRAITVGAEMRKDNVNPQRIAVVGYADQRPIASNSSEAGKAQNRRVEVLILPTTVKSAPVDVASTPSKTAPRNAGRTFNKDSTASTPTGPILNK